MSRIMITDKTPFFASKVYGILFSNPLNRGCVRGCVIHRVESSYPRFMSNPLNQGCVRGCVIPRVRGCVNVSFRILMSKVYVKTNVYVPPLVKTSLYPPVFLIGYCSSSLRDSSFCFFTTFIQTLQSFL